MIAATRRRIAVLMGGISREREVSLVSGDAVARALEGRGHNVVRVIVDDEQVAALSAARPEVAFIALHGRFGEDGGIQRRCAALGIPYTGSGPRASWCAMEKTIAKSLFEEAGVPTPRWTRLDPPFDGAAARALVRERPGFPCVVKPVAEGSSIGVTIVPEEEALGGALEAIERLGGAALVERFVEGREFTVGILGERALPPIELVPRRQFYDYHAKYDPQSGTEYRIDPPLAGPLREAILDAALAAHRALGCEAYSRVDVRVDGAEKPFVLEVNTIPGMTPRSLLPKAAAAAGIPFDELCERLCEDAIRRRGAGIAA
jgi:D-alanine-D-alanine ligase